MGYLKDYELLTDEEKKDRAGAETAVLVSSIAKLRTAVYRLAHPRKGTVVWPGAPHESSVYRHVTAEETLLVRCTACNVQPTYPCLDWQSGATCHACVGSGDDPHTRGDACHSCGGRGSHDTIVQAPSPHPARCDAAAVLLDRRDALELLRGVKFWVDV